MILKLFTQPGCPACPPAKNLAQKLEKEQTLRVEYIDVSQSQGLEEARKYGVMATPTFVLIDKTVKKIWAGLPSEEEILEEIKK